MRLNLRRPDDAILERVAKPATGRHYIVRLTCPEFTSLCPLTGQPDFAHMMVDYIPRRLDRRKQVIQAAYAIISQPWRFHEACTMEIAAKLVALLDPVWLRIGAYWYPRGGIPIDVFWQSGIPPADVWIPETGSVPITVAVAKTFYG